jgi:hypothetical protein
VAPPEPKPVPKWVVAVVILAVVGVALFMLIR